MDTEEIEIFFDTTMSFVKDFQLFEREITAGNFDENKLNLLRQKAEAILNEYE